EDPALPLLPDTLHPTGTHEGAPRMVTDARIQRDRTFDRLDDVPEGELPRGLGEQVAAMRSALRPHQSFVYELLHDLLEKASRDPLARGDLGDRADPLAVLFVG